MKWMNFGEDEKLTSPNFNINAGLMRKAIKAGAKGVRLQMLKVSSLRREVSSTQTQVYALSWCFCNMMEISYV